MRLLLIFILSIYLSSCATVGKIFSNDAKKDVTINTKYAVNIKLNTKDPSGVYDKNAKIEIKNNKTGKKWTFTHKEFVVIINSWKYWNRVSTVDPVISKVEMTNKIIIITFNYLDKNNKTSLLSGKIYINKKYFITKTNKENILIGITTGLGFYSLIITVLFFISVI